MEVLAGEVLADEVLADEVLAPAVWRARQAAHEARVDAWTGPVLARAARGETHPVEDFLFTYYGHSPAALRRWSPGAGVRCEDGPLAEAPSARVQRAAARLLPVLAATASRPAQLGCFGMHEWAMVHGLAEGSARHGSVPLRLGAAGTTAVVERLGVRCTHFDAFRFFTPTARPLNALRPTRETQVEHEQPGCLHATMDLYRAAYLLSPQVPSELVADCFDLARRVRVVDMRASPYDLAAWGLAPLAVETAAGRAEYVAAQRGFAAEAQPLRAELLDRARALAA